MVFCWLRSTAKYCAALSNIPLPCYRPWTIGRLRTPTERGQVTNGNLGYDALISYSHALDGTLARALQIGLERFAKPWYRPRVFPDTTSLPANPGLWSSIEKALASSAWLVLMASPEAARSGWVDREVAWCWRTSRRNDCSWCSLRASLRTGTKTPERMPWRQQRYHPHCAVHSLRNPAG